ncbi:hypothetical protein EAE96_003364 [Botrytis aclada]|nr:hypothetical protein EAE96_003364 [Botrytis aclada]
MYNIPLTTGISHLKTLFGTSTNIKLEMDPRNKEIKRNPLAALIATFIFSLIILTTLLYQLKNFLTHPKPLHPKATQPNTQESIPNELVNPNPNPLALHPHLEPPQPTEQIPPIYFNPRFQGIPNLQHLSMQVRENMDAIFVGAGLPWPDVMEAGFGYETMREIDREVGLQRRRFRDGELGVGAQDGDADGNAAAPSGGGGAGDTPGWMLALFEHGSENGKKIGSKNAEGNKNAESKTSALQKNKEEKPTCPICTDELPTQASIAKPCRHKFCTTCLEDWRAHLGGMDREAGQKITCPVCGVGIRRVGRGGGWRERMRGVWRRG